VLRKSHDEHTTRSFAGLQTNLGYWGMRGTGPVLYFILKPATLKLDLYPFDGAKPRL
jgi:hypothetical protein